MKKFEAHEVPLHEVFSSKFDFVIPTTNAHTLGVEQAGQLLDDLARLSKRARQHSPGAALLLRPRLVLRSRDAQFFEKQIQTPGSTTLLSTAVEDQAGKDAQRALAQNVARLPRIMPR